MFSDPANRFDLTILPREADFILVEASASRAIGEKRLGRTKHETVGNSLVKFSQ
jgi:hypothetical protein